MATGDEGRALDVEHVARLARLALTPEERSALGEQLAALLADFRRLAEVATEGVEPTAVPGLEPHVRPPDLRIELAPGEGVGAAPDRSGLAFRVPRVL